jgi:hypothetical protein
MSFILWSIFVVVVLFGFVVLAEWDNPPKGSPKALKRAAKDARFRAYAQAEFERRFPK